jgi:hypothetical protein
LQASRREAVSRYGGRDSSIIRPVRLASSFSGILLAVSAAFVAFGCSTSGNPPPLDGAVCPLNQSHYYVSPGCGTSAPAPVCEQDEAFDSGCTGQVQVCTCNGVTELTSCQGHAKGTFAFVGACPSDAGADSATDTGADTATTDATGD